MSRGFVLLTGVPGIIVFIAVLPAGAPRVFIEQLIPVDLILALYFAGEGIARLVNRNLRGALGSSAFLVYTLFTISGLMALLAR